MLIMDYWMWLTLLSALVLLFERIWPARKQRLLRKWLWSDYIHLIFNGHLCGVLLYGVVSYHIEPALDVFLHEYGLRDTLYFNAVQVWGWGLALQSVVALIVIDCVQWFIHNSLHRIDFLWRIHQVHHSVKDGEMDWIVSFRFSWLEPVYYKSVMFIPLIWFGFAPEALFFHAVLGTLIGHLNHANLAWDYGPLRYLFNSPHMHLHHHAHTAPACGQNFGIIFSCWDWIFGTAHLPESPPAKIGFPGVEHVPEDFFGQLIWPLPFYLKTPGTRILSSLLGGVILLGLYNASLPPSPEGSSQMSPVEKSASYQP